MSRSCSSYKDNLRHRIAYRNIPRFSRTQQSTNIYDELSNNTRVIFIVPQWIRLVGIREAMIAIIAELVYQSATRTVSSAAEPKRRYPKIAETARGGRDAGGWWSTDPWNVENETVGIRQSVMPANFPLTVWIHPLRQQKWGLYPFTHAVLHCHFDATSYRHRRIVSIKVQRSVPYTSTPGE